MLEHAQNPNLENFVIDSNLRSYVRAAPTINTALLWIHLLRPYWNKQTATLLHRMALSLQADNTPDILFPTIVRCVLLQLTQDKLTQDDPSDLSKEPDFSPLPMTLTALQELPLADTECMDANHTVTTQRLAVAIKDTNALDTRDGRIAGVYQIFLNIASNLMFVKQHDRLCETIIRKIDELMEQADILHPICLFLQHKLINFQKLNAVQRLRFYLERRFVYNVK